MKILKTMLHIIIGTLIVLVFLVGAFLFYINYTDYLPEPTEELQIIHKRNRIITNQSFELVSWNIGYAGLGKEMDFFYDGGTRSKTTQGETRRYMDGIAAFLRSNPDVDFWLLQEVDFHSKRTYFMDQSIDIAHSLPEYNYVSAVNYRVPFVPVPLSSPMGKVDAGMMSLSKFTPRMSRRYAYPLFAGWPDRMFLLDRCFIELRFNMGEGRELVLLNTHNTAYVEDQKLMDLELKVIHDKMLREYESGNYVIAGGDWNMNPPGLVTTNGYGGHRFVENAVKISEDFLPTGWKFSFGKSAPTNRDVSKAYIKGNNPTTTIDYFISSPNITVLDVETIDLGFEHSDHNPVRLKVILQ
ncbi:MAG TPA: hypothetical protein PK939_00140 [Bacteroidales bacterium]|nr:hypothetical protein [Bacteroidales bacterium]